MLVKNITSLLIVLLLLSYATGKTTVSTPNSPEDINSAIMSNKEMNKIIYYFLSSAEKGQVEYIFTNNNITHYHIMMELIEAGYLYRTGEYSELTSCTYSDKLGHKNEVSNVRTYVSGIRITLSGREYLERLRSKQFWPSVWHLFWKGLFWVITIALSAIIASRAIKMIDKMSLLKKNNK